MVLNLGGLKFWAKQTIAVSDIESEEAKQNTGVGANLMNGTIIKVMALNYRCVPMHLLTFFHASITIPPVSRERHTFFFYHNALKEKGSQLSALRYMNTPELSPPRICMQIKKKSHLSKTKRCSYKLLVGSSPNPNYSAHERTLFSLRLFKSQTV